MVKNGKRKKNRGLKDLMLRVNNELSDLDLSDRRQSATLPSEILAIVAAHLTGQLAFGSTANLNLACKAVQHETLPILWETFFFSHDPLTSKGKAAIRKLPAGIKHTKYIFFATEIDYDAKTDERGDFEHLERMPNVVMTVASDSGELVMDSDETWIRLYRPVSSATAFRILETPFRQAVIVDHADYSMFHGAFATGGMQARECRAQAMKPAVRALVTIQNLVFESGSYLHDRHPFHLPPIKTNLRLFKTDIVSSHVETRGSTFDSKPTDSKPTVTTLVELMKLAAMQKIRAHLHNIEM
ncbi:hypothetical protein QFC21_007101 [Naganishia friedmannii]|uniref:Uncharacterized protein n=1 Tax=Naganishia friedmannii TaxID=89922 RepID=A0ACC2UY66_9TREE|nr:hypothetical protein QFC21_007101 [Naganishia friedmannii]